MFSLFVKGVDCRHFSLYFRQKKEQAQPLICVYIFLLQGGGGSVFHFLDGPIFLLRCRAEG